MARIPWSSQSQCLSLSNLLHNLISKLESFRSQQIIFLHYRKKKKKNKEELYFLNLQPLNLQTSLFVDPLFPYCFLFVCVVLRPSLDPCLPPVTALCAFAVQANFLKELSRVTLLSPPQVTISNR